VAEKRAPVDGGGTRRVRFSAVWYEDTDADLRRGSRLEKLGQSWVVDGTRLRQRDPSGRPAEDRELEVALRPHEPKGRDWEGQVYLDRQTGRELMRNTDHALPHKPGDSLVVGPSAGDRAGRPRTYTIVAVEDDGDRVLADPDSPDPRRARPGGTGEEQSGEDSPGTFGSKYPRTLRYKKGERRGPKPPWEESKPG
jgi:hypothetical protein